MEVVRLPVRSLSQSKRLDPAVRFRAERQCVGIVGAQQQQAAPWNEVDEAAERQPDRVEVRVDVGMVVLDVADDRDVRQILEELRRLVEERAVVLVAFDDELTAASDAETAVE